MILKSGNLLCMARLNFRVKCNNQPDDIRNHQALSALSEAGIFLWNSPVRMNYTPLYITVVRLKGMIKWQAILLRMHSFPPHILNEALSTPEQRRPS
ncbi:MAG: hypothetical protein Q4C77_13230 [Eubacteriales bacterium]|nr:hypothetical protein [Eubacteriales bacterium]